MSKPEPSLFDEMDQAAREICFGSAWLPDCQIEFRQLRKARYPDWSEAEWLDSFAQWVDHYWAKVDMRVAALLAEGNALHRERALLPLVQHAAIDERLKAIAFEMADTVAPRLPPLTTPPASGHFGKHSGAGRRRMSCVTTTSPWTSVTAWACGCTPDLLTAPQQGRCHAG